MISAYSLSSLAGYILFYLGTYLALPALFQGYKPPARDLDNSSSQNQYTPNLLRLSLGITVFAMGGVLQVAAEFFWGFVFKF